MKYFFITIIFFFYFFNVYSQTTVNIPADFDNTIYQDYPTNSNAKGENIFSGDNNTGNSRRALIRFFFCSIIPVNSEITAVTLKLHCNRAPLSTSFNMSLHRIINAGNLGEGNSNAGVTNDGDGVPAQFGEVTWICSSSNGTGGCSFNWTWNTPGATFIAAPSATTSVGAVDTDYFWSSSGMVDDMRLWKANCDNSANQGWVLIGDETVVKSVKRFNSRQSATNQPVLMVTYIPTIPVKLISFTGQETKYGNALSWETAQEINNAFFSIEHSIDGTHFSSIGKVIGAGTTSIAQKYNFMHSGPSAGQHYYRLAQTDLDGKINYSHIVAINQKSVSKNILISPNPVKDKIVFQGFSQGKRSYIIIDFTGKKMMQGVLTSELRLPATLSPGTYYIRIFQDDGQLFTGKFVKE